MIQVYRITRDGFFLEDVLLQRGEAIPEDCVMKQAPPGFNWPRWDAATQEWVEGGGIWHKQPDGKPDPAKRHEPIQLADGSFIRRGENGKLTHPSKTRLKAEQIWNSILGIWE